jgi:FKBP-type peptidyl-prolyl cis-trans isomerase FklB
VVEAVVGSLLPGLAEAITSLPVGTKCKVYLPWQKAYGARGSNKVPPYSALVYDIELMKIVKK